MITFRRSILGLPVIVAAIFGSSALAGTVVVDSSFGHGQTLTGPNFSIPASLGRTKGSNLFQSFTALNLSPGDVATFTGPANVSNVLVRVTGGSASNIDGTLRSSIPQASFYLINPAGVVFGPGASIVLTGSFGVATAQEISLADGGHFAASTASDHTLSTAAPRAFGFLGKDTPRPISVTGSAVHPTALSVGTEKHIAIVGGRISIVDSSISASGGKVLLSSVGTSQVAIPLMQSHPSTPAVGGQISLSAKAKISADGRRGGQVVIQGDRLTATDSTISAQTTGDLSGKGIQLALSGPCELIRSVVQTGTGGAGDSGPIQIKCGSLQVRGDGSARYGIFSETTGSNRDISVSINASDSEDVGELSATLTDPAGKSVQLFDGGYATGEGPEGEPLDRTVLADNAGRSIGIEDVQSSSVGAFRPVHPLSVLERDDFNGNWSLRLNDTNTDDRAALTAWSLNLGADTYQATVVPVAIPTPGHASSSLTVNGFATITPAGAAGKIEIDAGNTILSGKAQVSASTYGGGAAGNIRFHASSLKLFGGASISNNGMTYGDAGNISIRSDAVVINGRSLISDINYGSGHGGDIDIYSRTLSIDGENAGDYTGEYADGIFDTAGASGNAGTIRLHSISLNCTNDGQIDGESDSAGAAAQIHLKSKNISFNGLNTGIVADSEGAFDDGGNAGNIHVDARLLILNSNAEIRSNTYSAGNAGNVSITSESIRDNCGLISTFADTGHGEVLVPGGSGGSLLIHAYNFGISDGGIVSASTSCEAKGGDIIIDAEHLALTGVGPISSVPSAITTSSDGLSSTGPAGSVDITAGILSISKQATITSDSGRSDPDLQSHFQFAGAAGNVNIEARQTLLTTRGSITARTFTSAAAGSIHLESNDLSVHTGGEIASSTAGAGAGGSVEVTAAHILVDQADVQGKTGIFAESAQLSQRRVSLYVQIPFSGDLAPTIDLLNAAGVDQPITYGYEMDNASGLFKVGFDDAARQSIGSSNPPLKGTYLAQSPLSYLGVGNPLGTWKLSIDNSQSAAVGSILAWSLDIGGKVFRSADTPVAITAGGAAASTIDVTGAISTFRHFQTAGRAGNVSVGAETLTLMHRAQISAEADGGGASGKVNVATSRSATLSGGSVISSSAFGIGDAGTVTVSSPRLTLNDSSAIRSQSAYTGTAGGVDINSGTLRVEDGATVAASAKKSAGGDVTIKGQNIELTDGQLIASAKENGGNIRVGDGTEDRPTLSLVDSKLLATSQDARGGNIDVSSSAFFRSPNAVINASSQNGPQGTVSITSPTLDIAGSLVTVETELTSASATLAEACGMQVGTLSSSFTLEGGNGLPVDPGGDQPSEIGPTTPAAGR